MSVKQISVFLENKPGSLKALTAVLAESRIDMRAFSLAETSDFGIARIIVDDVDKTAAVLKEAGFVHSITPVIGVALFQGFVQYFFAFAPAVLGEEVVHLLHIVGRQFFPAENIENLLLGRCHIGQQKGKQQGDNPSTHHIPSLLLSALGVAFGAGVVFGAR